MKKLPQLNEMISTKNIFRFVCIMFSYNLFNNLRNFVIYFNSNVSYLFNSFMSIGFGFFALYGFYRLYQREKILEQPNPIEFAKDNEFINSIKK